MAAIALKITKTFLKFSKFLINIYPDLIDYDENLDPRSSQCNIIAQNLK